MRFPCIAPLILMAAVAIDPRGGTTCSSCASLAKALTESMSTSQTFSVTGLVQHVIRSSKQTEIALTDNSGTCLVKGQQNLRVKTGQVVSLAGKIRGNRPFGPHAIVDTLACLRTEVPPPPISAEAPEIVSGKFDWQLVRLKGTVQDAFISEFNKDWMFITLNCGVQCVHASTPSSETILPQLTSLNGAIVDLIGVSIPQDGSIRTKIGRILHFAGVRDITVIRPPPPDPFDVPNIKDIVNLPASVVTTLGRHSAHGCVLAVWNEDAALLRTKDGLIVRVAFSCPPNACVGDFVKVIGLPESDLQNINLTSAAARPAPPFDCPDPPVINLPSVRSTPEKTMNDIAHWHGQTIRLKGLLRAKPTSDNPIKVFYLDTGGQLVSVNMSAIPEVLDSVSTESKLEITGTCVMDIENWRPRQTFPRINGFFVVLRSPEDIRVLSHPPWWTVARLLSVIGTLLAFLVGIFIWNVALRRVAARKGRELMREQLGHVKADLRTSERTRLAVELHDTLAQNLTGVSMELEAAADLRGEAPPDMMAHLSIATKALKSCRDELRNCLWDLRSQALEEKDMSTAILRTLQPCVADSPLAVRFEVPRSRLSDNTTHALLRVIRELVTNAIRHGAAMSVKVAGAIDGDKLLCSVTDNGGGFDPDTAPGVLQGHFGLQGIQERIAELGGTFEISSAPGKGTKATISLPIPHEC